MSKQVVHLHTHTEYSAFDGAGKQETYIERAKEMGNPAIGLTEHGSMRGVYKQDENCKNIGGIKPIYGIEFYLAKNLEQKGLTEEQKAAALDGIKGFSERKEALYQAEVKAGVRSRYHITAIAKNNEGLKNLYRLSSIGWLKGYYKRPRIDLETLGAHREGLIILSGCTSGALNEHLLNGDMPGAIAKAERLRDWFGDDFYLEIMPHGIPDQVRANVLLAKMSKLMGIPLVATQDAHWVRREDREAQEALLCINTNDVMANPERFKFDGDTYFLANRGEMEEMFRDRHSGLAASDVQSALDRTLEINEKATAALEIDRFKAMVPTISMPAEFKGDEFLYLRHLCMEGWDERNIRERAARCAAKHGATADEMYNRYIRRLRHELEAIRKQRVQRYFLVIWDMYNWARANRVMVGPGRGSAGGCLVSFLLHITQIDPMEHGLIFERFLAPGRIDLPDIDCDFEARRRDEVINFLRDRYGDDKTALIATVGTLKGKACLRDISRILQIPRHEVDEVADSIIERSSGDERASACLEDSFTEFKVCQDFNKKYPKVLQLAKKLEGQVRNLGMHAAGVVVSPEPLIDIVPLETRESSRANNGGKKEVMKVTAVDMYGAAGFGLMKIDILGLRNLDSIRDCLDAIKARTGKDIDLTWIDMEDPATLKGFTDHKYVGIFQYDTPSADKICEGVEFTAFEDVVAMIALDRPGTARSGLATEYIKRKRDPKARVSIHPIVDEICKDTLGVIVYQEHVLRIFTDVAGFSPSTADSLRKKIAKKWGDEAIGKERENFVKGAMERGFTKKLAEDLITKITFFGSYGFNKSHATAYGQIGYWQMWLKTHYPVEFMWSLMANEPRDEIPRLVKACRAMGIEVRAPEVNTSGSKWGLEGDAIVASMTDLKGVGEQAVRAIEEGRKAGPYKHFIDFMQRTERRKVNRRVADVLVKAGSFAGLVPNERWLSEHLEGVWELGLREKWGDIAKLLVASAEEPDWDPEERQHIASEVNPTAFGKHPVEPFSEFLNTTLKARWTSMGDEHLWDLDSAFLHGMIIEVKYNQVGDFHTGEAPTEDEKRRQKWGARYANVNIEDMSGKQNRVKVDVDIFDNFRHIVDKGAGTVVALHASIGKKWHSIRAHFLVDVAEMREKMMTVNAVAVGSGLAADPLTVLNPYELALTEFNPVLKHSAKDISAIAARVRTGTITVTGMVTHVNKKLDKKMNEMGFFGILGAKGYLDCLCFASSWDRFKRDLKPGRVVRITLKRDKSSNILDDRGTDPLIVLG